MAAVSISVYTLSEEVKHSHGKHFARYGEKFGREDLKMDVYLLPLSEFSDALKCNRGALPDFTANDLYHYAINSPSNYTGRDLQAAKLWIFIIILCEDG